MIEWRRVPWPLWVYFAVVLSWIFTLVINAFGLIPYLISGSLDWEGVAFGLINLLLLLLPVTRRYFSDGSVEAGLLGP